MYLYLPMSCFRYGTQKPILSSNHGHIRHYTNLVNCFLAILGCERRLNKDTNIFNYNINSQLILCHQSSHKKPRSEHKSPQNLNYSSLGHA